MRRFLSSFFIVIFLLWAFVPLVSAQELDGQTEGLNETEPGVESMLSQFSCQYDRAERKIVLAGIVRHEILVSHREYFLDVYRIPPGQTYESVVLSDGAKPVASTEISVRFEFALAADNMLDRFSHYAVILRSPDGERILAATPQYAEVESDYEYNADDDSAVKGLVTSETSVGGNLGIGTAVIPVYLDRLINSSSQGYAYSFSDGIVYFNHDYVDSLDTMIRTYSTTGSRVYLQYLLSANESPLALASGKNIGASYDMPNLFSADCLLKICAITEFLSERYVDYQSGRFCGVIVGASIDDPMMNYCGNPSFDRYAELYSLYLTAVSCSLRVYHPSADIVIPFSSENSYVNEVSVGASYPSGRLLEAILKIQDDGFSVPFRCGTMICMEADRDSKAKLTVESIQNYSAFIKDLRSKYESAPLHYMVRWNVPETMSETALRANYTYFYYKLITDPEMSSFLVSFSRCEEKGLLRLSELKQVLRYIDTDKSLSVTAPLVSYFGVESWDQMVEGATSRSYAARWEYVGDMSGEMPDNLKGSFVYLDFSGGNKDEWFGGTLCSGLRINYGYDGIRALNGSILPDVSEDFGEMMCLLHYPERFVYTPYLQFRMEVTDSSKDTDRKYHVMITLGNDVHRTVAQYIVTKDEMEHLTVDVSSFPHDQTVSYLKISVRPLGDVQKIDGEITVRLYDIVGYSAQYTSEELTSLIEEDRLNLRNLTGDLDEDRGEKMWWILGIVVLGIAVVISVFICFRSEDEGDHSEE